MDQFAVHIIKNLLELLRYYCGVSGDDAGSNDNDKKVYQMDGSDGVVTTEIVVVLKDLFRKYPELFEQEINEVLFNKVVKTVFANKSDALGMQANKGGHGINAALLNST